MMLGRCRRLYWCLSIFCIMLFIYLHNQRWNERLKSEDKTLVKSEKPKKKILIWTDYFQRKNVWKTVFQRHFSGECEETRCEFTLDKNEHSEADAVLFEGNSLELRKYRRNQERFNYPKGRKPHHIYIFFTTEPPTRFEDVKLENYANFFNWTMTYRRDSDVSVPFGLIKKRKTRKIIRYINEEELKGKKFAIWLNTHNCDSKPRIDFINSLQRYITIEKFGKCFNRKCGEVSIIEKEAREIGSDACEKTFSNHIFFMALENSMCRDYVTEKLYRSLKLGIIPITLGAVNYSEFAPPHSFIDAKKFQTEADLAIYLTKVANNVSLYNEYFKWQEDYEIDVGTPYKPLICDLCKELHSPFARVKKVYGDMKDWYITGSNCSNLLIRNDA